jgi:hypothetical protein
MPLLYLLIPMANGKLGVKPVISGTYLFVNYWFILANPKKAPFYYS